MPKVNVALIEGYETMTAEQKLQALENFEYADPDYSGYVKKDVFDKTASELADHKKQLRAKLSEDEAAKQQEKEEREKLQANYEKLLRESSVSKNKSKLLALGYDEKLADETAEAMTQGDTEKVFANQKKHLEALEKKVRADALKQTPPPTSGSGGETMTLDKLRKLSPQARLDYAKAHPEDYKTLYGGNE